MELRAKRDRFRAEAPDCPVFPRDLFRRSRPVALGPRKPFSALPADHGLAEELLPVGAGANRRLEGIAGLIVCAPMNRPLGALRAPKGRSSYRSRAGCLGPL